MAWYKVLRLVLSGAVVFEYESFIRGRNSSKLGRYKVIV